jgi:hypothetical protein
MSKILLVPYAGSNPTVNQVREWTQRVLHDRSYVLYESGESITCYYVKGAKCQNRGNFQNDQMADAFRRLQSLRRHRNGVIVCRDTLKNRVIKILGTVNYWVVYPRSLEHKRRPLIKADFRYDLFDLTVGAVEESMRRRLRKNEQRYFS